MHARTDEGEDSPGPKSVGLKYEGSDLEMAQRSAEGNKVFSWGREIGIEEGSSTG